VLCLLLAASAVGAQSRPDLLAVDSAFVNGQYETTEVLALRVLNARSDLTPDETARMNLTAGYAVIMLGREADAKVYFENALQAVPDLTLDPVAVSPKFRVVFDEVKAAHKPARPNAAAMGDFLKKLPNVPPAASPVPTRSFRRALLVNLVLPGTGQWLSGSTLKGAGFLAAEAVAAGYLIHQLGKLDDSRDRYLAETDPDRMRNAYDDYNNDHRAAWFAGIAAGVVYLGAQADLILFTPRPKTVLAFEPSAHNGVSLVMRW
jgi:hypothetical protein